MDWFRSWHGAPTDLKWPIVAERANEILSSVTPCNACNVTSVTAVTWSLLDHASQNSPRGSVVGFNVEGYAYYARMRVSEVTAIIQALHDKNVLKDNVFCNWAKRQSSESSERVRKHRERRRNGDVTHVTDVTPDKIREERVYTPRSKSHDSVNIASHSGEFEKLWSLWRPFEMVKGGKQQALKAYAKAMTSGVPSGILLQAADRYCRNCHQLRTKTQHLSTWLNQRGWEGVEEPRPYLDPSMRMPSPAGG